jgi:NAD-dependent dihydropyrimidine dehydrogenase PreA subunit
LLRLAQDAHLQRKIVQIGFVCLCVWIGVEFHRFVRWGFSGGRAPAVARPPGVEGFLPISALISIKHWALSGAVNDVHPASVFLLIAFVLMSIALKKAFCGWLCPVGTLSEQLWQLGRFMLGRTRKLPAWLDWPLRMLKYALLFFFVRAVWQMDPADLTLFLHSPYNKVADIKMYLFFANISAFALNTLILLGVASVVIKNPWCRFLCPYGALLGIAGWLSPLRVTRSESTCIDCRLCTRACPAYIRVHEAGRVVSDECTSCVECVSACPVKDTLEVRPSRTGRPLPAPLLGAIVLGIFVGVTGGAMLTGHWQNRISKQEYLRRFPLLDTPLYQHARGQVPDYGPDD